MKDKTVQVKLTNKLSSTAIKSSCIDMNQSVIESLDNVLSYAYSIVAIVLPVHKLWINHFKTAKHLNSFVLHCMVNKKSGEAGKAGDDNKHMAR
jgi:phage gp16-like protein